MKNRFLCISFMLLANLAYAGDQLLDNKWQQLLDIPISAFALSPNGNWLLRAHEQFYQNLEELSQPQVHLAGLTLAVNQDTTLPVRQYDRLTLVNTHDHLQRDVVLPNGASVVDFRWSPDSQMLALILKMGRGLRLYQYHLYSGLLKEWDDLPVSARFGNGLVFWLPDSRGVLLRVAPPIKIELAISLPSPRIEETGSTRLRRVYRNLLDSDVARRNFLSLTSQRLWHVALSGDSRPVTGSHMIERFSISPDGRYVLIKTFSDVLADDVDFQKLGRKYRIYSIHDGKETVGLPELAVARQARLKDSVPVGARLAHWLPGEAATLAWTEAQDGGDMKSEVVHHDRLYIWRAPFNTPQWMLLDVEWRLYDINWTTEGRAVFYSWRAVDQQLRTWTFQLRNPVTTKHLIQQRNYKDNYSDIGDANLTQHPEGYFSIRSNRDGDLYFFGKGRTEKGRMPFIDRYSFGQLKKRRIFQSTLRMLQSPLYILPGTRGNSILFTQESSALAPVLMKKDSDGKDHLLMPLRQPMAHSLASKPKLIRYERADGVQLHGKLYLPEDGSVKGRKYPTVIEIYPAESTDKAISEQLNIAANEYMFVNPVGPLPLLLDDIAVFEASTMPILSDGGSHPNDNYMPQLIADAEAMVDALKASDVVDISCLVLMGHSYGASSVAQLLASTDLFKAGIALSGAYNRTLTPLGFQSELRTLWEAPSTYINMSPFMAANKINEPLLLIHGSSDQNPGTMPLQSEMLFQAIQANGGTARLVMLPNEGHMYLARENVLRVWSEESTWIQRWLKQNGCETSQ